MSFPEINRWYVFLSFVGASFLFVGHNEGLGIFFIFYGLGVWITQTQWVNNEKEISGKDGLISIIFKIIGLTYPIFINFDIIVVRLIEFLVRF